jgi:hypothetical protein
LILFTGGSGEALEVRREEIQKRRMLADEPPHRAEMNATGERQGKQTVGVLALMASNRGGGGGRTAAAVLPIVHHGARSESESGRWRLLKNWYCERYCFKFGRCKK